MPLGGAVKRAIAFLERRFHASSSVVPYVAVMHRTQPAERSPLIRDPDG